MPVRLLSIIAVAALLAGPAGAFTAQNGLVVEPMGQGTFNVPYHGRSGAVAFWCAAGDYAVRVLHLPKTAPLYRVSEPPRRSGEGIVFSTDPARAASRTGLVRLWGGAGLSAAYARSLCNLRQNRG